MAIIKAPQPYAVNTFYGHTNELAMFEGEEILALNMYRVGVDDDTQTRCVCWNTAYEDTQQYLCPRCYGTTFTGGIKAVFRVWATFNDNRNQQERRRLGGVYLEGHNTVQTEAWPPLYQDDYLIRVAEWDNNTNTPVSVAERYQVSDCQNISIRGGSVYGNSNSLQIAQMIQAKYLPSDHVIYRFGVPNDETFPRKDGEPR